MRKVKIITDSTADLNLDLIEKLDIKTMPLKVNFTDKSYRDGIDINTEELYKLVEEKGELPKTSAISPGEFIEEFKKHRCFTKVAEHYGVSDNSIRKWCIKNGMPWRKSEMIDFIKNQDKKE